MRTIAVVSQKGGSGKTTVSTALAIGLWRRGRRVLLADIDPQRSSMEVLNARRTPGPEAQASSGAKLFTLQTQQAHEGLSALVIDTPSAMELETPHAVSLCDLAVMVLRPTYLDLAAAVNTSRIIRQLNKPGIIVLNQAPVARGGVEPPIVKRTLEALKLLRLPIAPLIVRSRAVHQTALEQGLSAEEVDSGSLGGREAAALVAFIQGSAFDQPLEAPAMSSALLQAASVHPLRV